ncbi:MAG TPA: protein kinase [Candidatus Binatia bacterium]|nr:protein kinase [Candidatus Binatia bacterium]
MAAPRDKKHGASMTPERWQQVKSTLAEVLEVAAPDRPAYLDEICNGDDWLREEIENLLAADQGGTSMLGEGFAWGGPGLTGCEANARIGHRIGPYQIVEEIGAGGMGEVYRAFRADDHYRKQVAIKLVRAGQDSKFVVGRFKNERQVLASLDHPNIARLLDGGTTEDGIPYFVMELIEGQPMHLYCAEHNLSATKKIELFLQVCSAVQYAHQRLIIHRDLKPGNILVTADGAPKLLDFGIAKILDPAMAAESTEATQSIFRMLTPRYASPEQINGGTITTASDVYSLGVVLHELLTGRWPYRCASLSAHEIARAVCEDEPERPSAAALRGPEDAGGGSTVTQALYEPDLHREKLGKLLRGDLDNIVLMALRKEPERRYSSVEQLAADLRRHMENLPVSASRDTVRYRALKFTRRHKAGVASTAAVLVTLLAGMAITVHEARIARAQEARAQQRFKEVRELANSLLFDVHDSIQDLPGSTPARKLLVERALRYLDGLARDSSADTSLQRELATAYEKVGTVQGNPFGANLGDSQGAFGSYRKSLLIREEIVKADPGNADDLAALARSQRMYAVMVSNRTNGQGADNTSNELAALSTAEHAYQLAPSNPRVLEELQAHYDFLVTLLHYSGDYRAALNYLQKERPIVEARLQAAPADRGLQLAMGKLEIKSGDEMAKLGLRKEGQEHAQRGIQIFQAMSAEGTDANAKRYLGFALDRYGDSLLMDGDAEGALNAYQEDERLLESLLATDPTNAVVQLDVGTALAKSGRALAFGGDSRKGLLLLHRAEKMFEAQVQRDPSYSEPRWYLQWTLIWTGEALGRRGDTAEALQNYRKVLVEWEQAEGPFLQSIAAGIHVKIGEQMAKSAPQEAAQEYERALAILQQVASKNPNMLEVQYAMAGSYAGLGDLSCKRALGFKNQAGRRLSDWTEARDWYQRSASAWQQIQNPGAITPIGFICGNPSKIAAALAECDAQLEKLKAIAP